MLTGAVALAANAQPPRVAASAFFNSGIMHERLGMNREAVIDFTHALAAKGLSRSDRVRAIFDRGVAYDALGNTKSALKDYSEAIHLDPSFAPAHNNRANVYRRIGLFREAKRDYLAALSCRDVSPEYPYYGLGQIAEKEGKTETAREFYQKALKANPGYVLASRSLWAMKDQEPPREVRPVAHNEAHPRAATVPVAAVVPAAAPMPKLRDAILGKSPRPMQVQLGAFRDQEQAMAAWSRITAADSAALANQSPQVTTVDLPGKGRFWRLRTAVGDVGEARRICADLTAHNIACLPVKD